MSLNNRAEQNLKIENKPPFFSFPLSFSAPPANTLPPARRKSSASAPPFLLPRTARAPLASVSGRLCVGGCQELLRPHHLQTCAHPDLCFHAGPLEHLPRIFCGSLQIWQLPNLDFSCLFYFLLLCFPLCLFKMSSSYFLALSSARLLQIACS
jgi:hypothetical protein